MDTSNVSLFFDPQLETLLSHPLSLSETERFAKFLSCASHEPPTGHAMSVFANPTALPLPEPSFKERAAEYVFPDLTVTMLGARVTAVSDPSAITRDHATALVVAVLRSACSTLSVSSCSDRISRPACEIGIRRILYHLNAVSVQPSQGHACKLFWSIVGDVYASLVGARPRRPALEGLIRACTAASIEINPKRPAALSASRPKTSQANDGPSPEGPLQPLYDAAQYLIDAASYLATSFTGALRDLASSFFMGVVGIINPALGELLSRGLALRAAITCVKDFVGNHSIEILNAFLLLIKVFLLTLQGVSWTAIVTVVALDAATIAWMPRLISLASQWMLPQNDEGVLARAIAFVTEGVARIASATLDGLAERWADISLFTQRMKPHVMTLTTLWTWCSSAYEFLLASAMSKESYAQRLASKYPWSALCLSLGHELTVHPERRTRATLGQYAYARDASRGESTAVPKSIRQNYAEWLAPLLAIDKGLANGDAAYHSKPILVLFLGKPGVGKSSLVRDLTQGMAPLFKKYLQVERSAKEMLCTPNPHEKFQSTYESQPYMNLDDLGQVIPKTSDDLTRPEWSFIMTYGSDSTEKNVLNPEAEKKKQKTTLHGLFWSSNMQIAAMWRVLSGFVVEPYAYFSRFTIIARVELRAAVEAQFDGPPIITKELIDEWKDRGTIWELHLMKVSPQGQESPLLDEFGNAVIVNPQYIFDLIDRKSVV